MRKLTVGLIGCGVMGRNLMKGCLELRDRVTVTAACDADHEVLEAFCSEIGLRAHTGWTKMLASEALDAAIVATPPFLHRRVTESLADAGVHVFCEKPMAASVEDCDAMIARCCERDVALMIGQVCRFHAVHSKVKELVESGDFGPPLCMIVQRLGGGFDGVWTKDWRRQRAMSGGDLMEINAHEIDFMRWVCGEAKSVCAVGTNHPKSGADFPEAVIVSIEFANGAIGSLHSSSISSLGMYGGRVDCERGALHFPAIWGDDAGIHVKRGEETDFIPAVDIAVETPVTHELRVFFEALTSGRPPPVTGADGRAAVAIAEAAYASIEQGRPIGLPLS